MNKVVVAVCAVLLCLVVVEAMDKQRDAATLRKMHRSLRSRKGATCTINSRTDKGYEIRTGECLSKDNSKDCPGWSDFPIDREACGDGMCCVRPQRTSCGSGGKSFPDGNFCVIGPQQTSLCGGPKQKIDVMVTGCPYPSSCCIWDDNALPPFQACGYAFPLKGYCIDPAKKGESCSAAGQTVLDDPRGCTGGYVCCDAADDDLHPAGTDDGHAADSTAAPDAPVEDTNGGEHTDEPNSGHPDEPAAEPEQAAEPEAADAHPDDAAS